MKRREFLLLFALALAASPARAHTPYGQWKLLRQRYLLIHSTRTDASSDAIAERLVATLKRLLPKANALVARAPDLQRIASLLTTGQAVLAVMRPNEAARLFKGEAPFGAFFGGRLRIVLHVEDHLLVSVVDFPAHHAWLLAAALTEEATSVSNSVPSEAVLGVPVHAGAAAFRRGEPLEAMQ
jgi:hypothetical protein